jgi:hypothetical protein
VHIEQNLIRLNPFYSVISSATINLILTLHLFINIKLIYFGLKVNNIFLLKS